MERYKTHALFLVTV